MERAMERVSRRQVYYSRSPWEMAYFSVQKWEGPGVPTKWQRLLWEDPFQTIRPIDIALMFNEELERFHEKQCRLLFKR